MKANYWEQSAEGLITRAPLLVLLEANSSAQDKLLLDRYGDEKITEWDSIKELITPWSILLTLDKFPVIRHLTRRFLIEEVSAAWQVCIGFIYAHKSVKGRFFKMLKNEKNVAITVYNQMKEDIDNAVEYVKEIQEYYPDLLTEIQTSHAVRIILRRLLKYNTQLYDSGDLDDKEIEKITSSLVLSKMLMKNRLYRVKPLSKYQRIKQIPMFNHLGEKRNEIIKKIADIAKEDIYESDSDENIIVRQGDTAGSFFILTRGTVRLTYNSAFRELQEEIDPDALSPATHTIHNENKERILNIFS